MSDLCVCGHPHVNPDGSGSCSVFTCSCRTFAQLMTPAVSGEAPGPKLVVTYATEDGQVIDQAEISLRWRGMAPPVFDTAEIDAHTKAAARALEEAFMAARLARAESRR